MKISLEVFRDRLEWAEERISKFVGKTMGSIKSGNRKKKV